MLQCLTSEEEKCSSCHISIIRSSQSNADLESLLVICHHWYSKAVMSQQALTPFFPRFPLSSSGKSQGRMFPQQKPRKNCMMHTLFPSWLLTKCHHPVNMIGAMLGCFAFCLIRSGQIRSDQIRSEQHSRASCRHITDVGSPSVCAADCLTMCVNRRRATGRQLLPHRLSVLLTVSPCLLTGEKRRGGNCCHTGTG